MRGLCALLLAGVLSGCGTAYISPEVSTADSGVDVRVISLTGESVVLANRETAYRPRSLPAAFSQTAGVAGSARGAGALPDPVFEAQSRPAALELRVPPPVEQGPYVIGVGDVVILATRQSGSTVEELTGLLAAQNRRQGYTVRDDGAIAIPDVGRIVIAGLTVEQAEDEIFQRLVTNQIDPSFSLEVAEFNSKRVSIGGAVARPSVVPVQLTPLFLEEALSAVGGVQTTTDDRFVTIRLYRDGTLYQIPLTELYSRDSLRRIELTHGDSIFVDTAYELDQAQGYFEQQIRLAEFRQRSRQQALAELDSEISIRRAALDEARSNYLARTDLGAVERDYVYLTGEVASQSRFALPFESRATLADALYDSGGLLTETANPSQIYVLRASADPRDFGAVSAWHLDGSNAVNMILATRFELRPDDIVFVAEQPITRWNRVVRQIVPSLITTGVASATN